MKTAATIGGQLLKLPEQVTDTKEIALLRNADSYETLLSLGKALSKSFRYLEAIDVYTEAIQKAPDKIEGYRLRGGRYLSTLQPENAIRDLQRCRTLGGEESDLSYRIGLAYFYAGNYEMACREMEKCWQVSHPEMQIAAIYWHTLSAWRLGMEPILLSEYRRDMDVGHHTGYRFAVSAIAEKISCSEILEVLNREPDDLEFSMMAYGIAESFRIQKKTSEACQLHTEVLKRNSFWISFAYLAEWNDQMNGGVCIEVPIV